MAGGMVAGGITIKFSADLSNLTTGAQQAMSVIKSFSSSTSGMSDALTSVAKSANDTLDSLSSLGDESNDAGKKLSEAGSSSTSFKDSLGMISGGLLALGSNIGGVIAGRLSPFTSAVQQLGSRISDAASGPINSFISKVQDLSSAIGDRASSAFSAVSDKVTGFASAINDRVSNAVDGFTSRVQQLGSKISDTVSGPINAFTDAVQKIGSKISDAASGPINTFTSGVQQVGSKIGDAVSGPFNSFTNSIKKFASDIEEAATGPLADIISGIKSLGSNISEAASGPLNTLSNGVKTAFSGIQNVAQGAMNSIKDCFTKTTPSLGDFVGGIKNAASGFLDFAGSILRSTGILSGFTNPIGLLKSQISDTTQVAMRHQEVMAQTAQAIKSTGGACGMSAQAISDLATSLSKTTTFSNDTIQAGQNLLLTFTGIGKNVFPQTTQTMLDMAQAMHMGPTQAALQLGKALNDPARGLTALTREGVTFSDKQKEMIKHMVAVGDTAGAQKIMLKELQKEFGGSAQAAGKTFAGSLQILQNNLEDAKQKIGGALLPILGQLTGNITSAVMPAINGFADFLQSPAFQSFASGVGKAISDAFTSIGNVLKTIDWKTFKDDFASLGQQLAPILTGLKPPNNNVFKDVGGVIKNVVQGVGDFAKHLGDVVKWFKDGGTPATILKDALIGVGIAIGLMKIGEFVAALPGMIAGIWGWATAQGAVAVETLLTALPYILIGALVIGIIALIVLAVMHWGDIVKWLTGVWSAVAGFFEWLWGKISGFFVGVGHWFKDRFTEAYNGVIGAFGATGKWFQDLWKGICDDFNSILGGLGDLATNIWNGVTGAFKSGINWLIDQVNNFIKGINSINVAGMHVSIPLIPHLASGTDFFSGGLALVGEQGPELVNLPRGSSVLPASATYAAMAGARTTSAASNNQTIIVQSPDIYLDNRKVSDTVASRIIEKTRYKGGVRAH